ncbi:GGDEF domain-containing protein [Mycolicibacterium sp.]|uniref:GGDEF domain-containing protein n=1 Tax=Mycolicibacterium sp. TaxID=2320850 RepID=UPI003452D622
MSRSATRRRDRCRSGCRSYRWCSPGWPSRPSSPTLKSGPVLVVGLVLLLAVLARQYLAVNEDRQLLAQLSEQSRHDPLTGLANRVRFDERLRQALRMPGRPGRQVGVLAIDLNDFKLVNDALGHSAGDELLIAVADRLRGCVGDDDAIARLGGDEFAVPVEGVSDDARRGRRAYRGFLRPAFPRRGSGTADPSQRRTGRCGARYRRAIRRGVAQAGRFGDVRGKAVRVRRCPCPFRGRRPG